MCKELKVTGNSYTTTDESAVLKYLASSNLVVDREALIGCNSKYEDQSKELQQEMENNSFSYLKTSTLQTNDNHDAESSIYDDDDDQDDP
jgi:hypothetical protein